VIRWAALLCGVLLVSCGGHTVADSAAFVTPAQTAVSGRVVASVHGAKPGERAAVTVAAAPNARCTIVYETPDGKRPRAAGLEPKTTDAQGRAVWSWPIAATTATGIGMVQVLCDGIASEPVRIFIG
jgi:hypothetical protein